MGEGARREEGDGWGRHEATGIGAASGGSGALERIDGAWKIQQYHLTIPIPNDLAKDFVARIRDAAAAKKGAP